MCLYPIYKPRFYSRSAKLAVRPFPKVFVFVELAAGNQFWAAAVALSYRKLASASVFRK